MARGRRVPNIYRQVKAAETFMICQLQNAVFNRDKRAAAEAQKAELAPVRSVHGHTSSEPTTLLAF